MLEKILRIIYMKFPMADSFVSMIFGGVVGHFIPKLISSVEDRSISLMSGSLWGTIITILIAFLYYYKMSPHALKHAEDSMTWNQELLYEELGATHRRLLRKAKTVKEVDQIWKSVKTNWPEITTVPDNKPDSDRRKK